MVFDSVTMKVPLWINGEPQPSSTNETYEVLNPSTKKAVSIAASATSKDCRDAVDAAHEAFSSWEATSSLVKRSILLKAANLLLSDKYKEAYATAMEAETACSRSWAIANISYAAEFMIEAASLATQVKGETFPSTTIPGAQVIVQARPYGAVFAIAPWNAPAILTVRAISIPLICGNTVVLKCSELSPRSQVLIVEALHEAGIPPGVLNYLSISRDNSPTLVPEIIAHPSIRHLNFTGSDRVGKILAAEAAKHLKPCVFELGGKAPAVVLSDANIDDAARAIVSSAMIQSGQICMSTERVIVQREVSKPLIELLTKLCSKIKAGVVTDPGVQLPPLFCDSHAENVVSMIKEAQDCGADVLVGDVTSEEGVVQPHLLLGVKPGMRAWERESFGPVLGVVIVDSVDEAIDMANASEYSLTASLWTKDMSTGLQTASRIRAGSVSINGPTFFEEVASSHVGLGGATGYGRFDIQHFTIKRMVVVHPPNQKYLLVD